MQPRSDGLSLQIFETAAKIVLAEFLVEAKLKSVGALDDNLNNQRYNYITATSCIASPWYQANPLKALHYPEGFFKIEDFYLVYPSEPAIQTQIRLLPNARRGVFYLGQFVIHANLNMGADVGLSGAVDGSAKRFLTITEASIFPMFPANQPELPRVMPIALLNRSKISHFYAAER